MVIRAQQRIVTVRGRANRRVAYASRSAEKVVQSLRDTSWAKSCPPIGTSSNPCRGRATQSEALLVNQGSKRSVSYETLPGSSPAFVVPPPMNPRTPDAFWTLTPPHSEYQARCHGSKPMGRAHPHRYPSEPQGTFITILATNLRESDRCELLRTPLPHARANRG